MESGDIVHGTEGKTYRLAEFLGSGTFGKTWRAEGEDGKEYCLKFPLQEGDLTGVERGGAGDLILKAFPIILRETGRFYSKRRKRHLPRVVDYIEGPPTCLILECYSRVWDQELSAKRGIGDILHFFLDLLNGAREALNHTGAPFHGNLKPENIFMDREGIFIFTDFLIPPLRLVLPELSRLLPSRFLHLPVEMRGQRVTGGLGENPFDFYSLSFYLARRLKALAFHEEGDGGGGMAEKGISSRDLGILKRGIETLSDRSGISIHYRPLLIDHFTSTLRRALSPEDLPSPPHRFYSFEEFHDRISLLYSLTRPSILSLSEPTFKGIRTREFYEGEDINLSVSILCTRGTERPDLLNVRFKVEGPPGRLFPRGHLRVRDIERFHEKFLCKLSLKGMVEGDYRIHLIFSLKGVADSEKGVEFPLKILPPPESSGGRAQPRAITLAGSTGEEGFREPASPAHEPPLPGPFMDEGGEGDGPSAPLEPEGPGCPREGGEGDPFAGRKEGERGVRIVEFVVYTLLILAILLLLGMTVFFFLNSGTI